MKLNLSEVVIILLLTQGVAVHAFDLGDFANAAKKVTDLKKSQEEKEKQSQEREREKKAEIEMMEKMPSWEKLLYFTILKQGKIKPEDVVLQYWIAQSNSNYEEVKDNEFEFEKQKQQKLDELKSNISNYKNQEFTLNIFASLGKYNFKKKSIPVEGAVSSEDRLLLTTSRDGQFETQKPIMTITPNPVAQEDGWYIVPTGFIFEVINPQIFSSIAIDEELAKKIAAVQGVRMAKADVNFEVVDVDLKNKKLNKSGTVGVIKIKIKDVKAYWYQGGADSTLIGISQK